MRSATIEAVHTWGSSLHFFAFFFLTAHLDGTQCLFPMVDYPLIHPFCPHLFMLCEDGNIPKRLQILRFIQWLGLYLRVPQGTLLTSLRSRKYNTFKPALCLSGYLLWASAEHPMIKCPRTPCSFPTQPTSGVIFRGDTDLMLGVYLCWKLVLI